jgi:ferredoxin-thioredoxin reductase catalytic subunit
MLKKIDMSSEEFLTELEKTKKFTDKICKQFGFEYHPIHDVNEGVTMGLARNKMLYDKRYCPCFMVIPDEKKEGKYKSADDRTCPCKPALEHEIQTEGKCHCGIFCTPEYVKANS